MFNIQPILCFKVRKLIDLEIIWSIKLSNQWNIYTGIKRMIIFNRVKYFTPIITIVEVFILPEKLKKIITSQKHLKIYCHYKIT